MKMILLIGGQKGGCGKTNLATNLAAYYVNKGVDLILLDTDKAQNSSAKWAARRGNCENIPKVNSALAHDDIRNIANDLSNRYELIIIDAGGRDSMEFRTALTVANTCLIPFIPSQHDIDTLPLVNDLICQAKTFNQQLIAYTVLSNCPQNKLAREKRLESMPELFKELPELTLLNTRIINRIAYTDSASTGQGVTEMSDPKASSELTQLAKEIFNA